MEYPYGPPLRTTPQKRIKIRNNSFTYGLSNRLLVSAKFRTLQCANVTFLGSGSGQVISLQVLHIVISFAVAIQHMKDREASGKPRNLGYFPSAILFSPFLAWIRELVPGFVICSAELQIQTRINGLKVYIPKPD